MFLQNFSIQLKDYIVQQLWKNYLTFLWTSQILLYKLKTFLLVVLYKERMKFVCVFTWNISCFNKMKLLYLKYSYVYTF